MPPSLAFLLDLSPADKLKLIGELWDDLSAKPECIPVEEWQIEELDRRKANLENNPDSALTWDEVKKQVRERNGR